MPEKLISGDNHIDLTYCPPDLRSSAAPNKWKLSAPRVEEMEDGLHWFVEAQDKGMWGSDYPHSASTFPQSSKILAEILAEILAGVPDDDDLACAARRQRKPPLRRAHTGQRPQQ